MSMFERPPLVNSLLELRAPFEALSLIPTLPLLSKAPAGDGQPVMVLPGFLTSDGATFLLRRFLTRQGFETFPWEQGRNPGLRQDIHDNLEQLIRRHHEALGQKISLVGWSLGGVYARALAHRIPQYVRQVITLGSPFALNANFNSGDVAVSGPIIKLYERMNPNFREDTLANGEPVWEDPPPVPSTAIYTEEDGIASWKYCVDDAGPYTENIRISGSHTGLTHNPLVMYAIANRLAQPEGQWAPFERHWLHRVMFRKPVTKIPSLRTA
jgi:pimeloyl-ACP methyl ester carboxylesterase